MCVCLCSHPAWVFQRNSTSRCVKNLTFRPYSICNVYIHSYVCVLVCIYCTFHMYNCIYKINYSICMREAQPRHTGGECLLRQCRPTQIVETLIVKCLMSFSSSLSLSFYLPDICAHRMAISFLLTRLKQISITKVFVPAKYICIYTVCMKMENPWRFCVVKNVNLNLYAHAYRTIWHYVAVYGTKIIRRQTAASIHAIVKR